MNVKVEVETVDAVRRRLAVEVPADEVSTQLNAEYARLAKSARVPGFRPGRAPRHVLQQLFGDRVQAEVFERLIQQSLVEAMESNGLEAVGRPELVTKQAAPGEPLIYSATVEVKPTLVIGDYAGLEVERPIEAVEPAHVEQFLVHLRESMAQLHPVTDRDTVAAGDVVRLDYEARLGDTVVGRGEQRDVEVGANGFPPEFDRHLIGARAESQLDFPVTYAEDAAGSLAGKTVSFRVKVGAIFSKEVPPLDDEFAKDHGECSTLDELRERVRKQLEQRAIDRGNEAMRRTLLGKLVEANDPMVPRALVERRLSGMVEEARVEAERAGRWPRQDAGLRERLAREFEPQATFEVKAGLLLEAIARQEGIEISEAELDERIGAIAAQANQAAERVRAVYGTAEARRHLRARMLQSKAIDAVARQVKIRDVGKSSVADSGETG
jgi:trigger factor